MPESMNTAVISLLPKPKRDHTQMGNFRPLSLLNNDYKIFTKMLAVRLEKVIPSIINLDQVGFISGRKAAQNMRRLYHIMTEAKSLYHPAVAISLDAEKAFDRIEWSYLLYILSKYGFGQKCIQWVRAMYNKPIAVVKTNRQISSPFRLFRSTKQGCPASPSLFILAIEPLACAIRSNKNISGITLHNYDFKINLFADDVLLTLSPPEKSIPHLLQLICDFGTLSGYKINWSKSEAIPLNSFTYSNILKNASIIWKPQGMKYLGIKIKSPIDSILELNLPELLKTIKEDLKRWSSLPLSLWGRGEILKMNILPRLSFLFSSIPLKIPQKWFNDMNRSISNFLWGGKKAKISRKKLSISRTQGGLGIPDMFLYYLFRISRAR